MTFPERQHFCGPLLLPEQQMAQKVHEISAANSDMPSKDSCKLAAHSLLSKRTTRKNLPVIPENVTKSAKY